MTNINVGYNPKDFFYTNAVSSGDMPKNCSDILNSPYNKEDCKRDEYFIDNRKECLDRKLCENKALADTILDIQQSNSGSQGKYNDSLNVFNRELFKTANLSIGIVGLMVLIYRFRKL
jgi:hypothetical protein|tara:strand:- start:9993 stop:10346 length:354 start_codon:yes stop_codon:yes gene_type:complete